MSGRHTGREKTQSSSFSRAWRSVLGESSVGERLGKVRSARICNAAKGQGRVRQDRFRNEASRISLLHLELQRERQLDDVANEHLPALLQVPLAGLERAHLRQRLIQRTRSRFDSDFAELL